MGVHPRGNSGNPTRNNLRPLGHDVLPESQSRIYALFPGLDDGVPGALHGVDCLVRSAWPTRPKAFLPHCPSREPHDCVGKSALVTAGYDSVGQYRDCEIAPRSFTASAPWSNSPCTLTPIPKSG